MTSHPEDPAAEILAKLVTAGAAGLKKTPLLGKGKKDQATKLAALETLVNRREVVRLGTERLPVFVLHRFYNPLEMAYAAIEAKATPGTTKLYTEKEFGVKLAKHVKEKIPEAIRLLLGERKLLRTQRARSFYYLHTAAILPLVGAAALEPAPGQAATPEGWEISWEEVRRAYDTVVRGSGFSDVLVSDLHRASAIPLDQLKPFLLAQSRAGRVAPSRGDWSLADAAAREAALYLEGEPYLQIRLL